MRTHLVLPIGLAALLLLGLCTALAGQAVAISDYTLATDDGLALSLSGDSQITSLQIDGTELVAAPGPALLLRDLSQAGAVTQPNLIGNPGFEQGMAGWTEASNTGLNVSVAVSPTHDGGYALELSNPLTVTYGFAAYASDPVLVTPGQRYRVSAWWRSATGYVTRPAGPPTLWQMRLGREMERTNALYVQWLDASGRPLDDAQLAVPLHWNAGHWRLIRRELTAPLEAAQARVAIGARLSGETVWVDDVTFVASPETEVPATGTVRPCLPELAGSQRSSWEVGGTRGNSAACLIQSIPLPEAGLAITVTYTAHADHIAVHGEVVDTTGQDRALDVMWSVPVTGEGWTWWDDAHTSLPITDTRTYANAISAIYDGWLSMSLYPYAGIALSPTPPAARPPPPPPPTTHPP
ncbi:MAG: carbohydrate binding domain-containing protein, partial [Anaerolineae bacterium]